MGNNGSKKELSGIKCVTNLCYQNTQCVTTFSTNLPSPQK